MPRRHRETRGGWRGALTLGALLALGAVHAAPGETAEALCRRPEVLLDITVGGASRGTLVVHLSEDATQALIPIGALRETEAPYVAQRLDCDGAAYVSLSDQVSVTYDQARQRLQVRPKLDRLTGNTLDLRGARIRPAPAGLPVWGVEYGVAAQAAYSLTDAAAPRTLEAGLHTDLAGASGALSGSAGVLVTREEGRWAAQPRAQVEYALSDEVSVGAAWNAQPLTGTPGLTGTSFRGMGVSAQGGLTTFVAERTLDLPLDADVVVYLNGVEVASKRVAPGVLRLVNIPHASAAQTVLLVEVTDETGRRTQEWTFDPEVSPLPAGAYLLSAQAGVAESRWGVTARGEYGLPRGWRVGASAEVAGGAWSAQGRLAYNDATRGVQVSVQSSAAAPAPGQARVPVTALGLRGETQVGAARVSAFTVLPLGAWRDSQLGAALLLDLDPWTLQVSGRTALRPASWVLDAAVTRSIGPLGRVTLSGSAQPGGWRIGLSGGYRPAPRWDLSAQAVVGTAPLPAGGSSAPAWQASATAGFQADPGNRFTATVLRDDVQVGVNHVGRVLASGTVGLRGSAARVQGAVAVLPGGVSAQATLGQRGVLLQTGVPGLSLLLNGTFVGRTDASGSLLISGLTPGETAEVRVDLRDAPFGVQVGTDRRVIVPPRAGLSVVDWRANFLVSRWVQVRAGGQPVASGSLIWADGSALLDDEGYGLVPQRPLSFRAEVRAADGPVICAVQIAPADEVVQCPPGMP